MRSLRSTLRGLRRAAREPKLAAILWLAQLALAAVAIAPVAVALADALAHSPRGDLLLERFRIETVVDLMRQAPAIGATLRPALAAMVALGVVGNALLAGGTLEVLTARDAQPVGHRFGRGAGRFAGRFLRVGAVAAAVGAVAALLATVPFSAVRAAYEESTRAEAEAVRVLTGLAALAAAGLAFTMVLMALDLARARAVRDDRRDTVRLFLRSLGTFLRHPLRIFGLWGWNALLRALVIAAGMALAGLLPTTAWGGIVALFVVQQAAFYARAALRVALWSSELELLDTL